MFLVSSDVFQCHLMSSVVIYCHLWSLLSSAIIWVIIAIILKKFSDSINHSMIGVIEGSSPIKIRVHRTEKSSKKCLKRDILLKGTNFGSFRTISQSVDLGSFFGLLRWDHGLNALLLSTKKSTFQTTWILTYKGLSNPPLGYLGGITHAWQFCVIFLLCKEHFRAIPLLATADSQFLGVLPSLLSPYQGMWSIHEGTDSL